MLSLIAVNRFKLQGRLIFPKRQSCAEVISLTSFRSESGQLYQSPISRKARLHVLTDMMFARGYGHREIGIVLVCAYPRTVHSDIDHANIIVRAKILNEVNLRPLSFSAR